MNKLKTQLEISLKFTAFSQPFLIRQMLETLVFYFKRDLNNFSHPLVLLLCITDFWNFHHVLMSNRIFERASSFHPSSANFNMSKIQLQMPPFASKTLNNRTSGPPPLCYSSTLQHEKCNSQHSMVCGCQSSPTIQYLMIIGDENRRIAIDCHRSKCLLLWFHNSKPLKFSLPFRTISSQVFWCLSCST